MIMTNGNWGTRTREIIGKKKMSLLFTHLSKRGRGERENGNGKKVGLLKLGHRFLHPRRGGGALYARQKQGGRGKTR